MKCKHEYYTKIGDIEWCLTCGALKMGGSRWTSPARQKTSGTIPKWWKFPSGTKVRIDTLKQREQ